MLSHDSQIHVSADKAELPIDAAHSAADELIFACSVILDGAHGKPTPCEPSNMLRRLTDELNQHVENLKSWLDYLPDLEKPHAQLSSIKGYCVPFAVSELANAICRDTSNVVYRARIKMEQERPNLPDDYAVNWHVDFWELIATELREHHPAFSFSEAIRASNEFFRASWGEDSRRQAMLSDPEYIAIEAASHEVGRLPHHKQKALAERRYKLREKYRLPHKPPSPWELAGSLGELLELLQIAVKRAQPRNPPSDPFDRVIEKGLLRDANAAYAGAYAAMDHLGIYGRPEQQAEFTTLKEAWRHLANLSSWLHRYRDGMGQVATVAPMTAEKSDQRPLPQSIWTVEDYYRTKKFYDDNGLWFNPALEKGSPAACHVIAQHQMKQQLGHPPSVVPGTQPLTSVQNSPSDNEQASTPLSAVGDTGKSPMDAMLKTISKNLRKQQLRAIELAIECGKYIDDDTIDVPFSVLAVDEVFGWPVPGHNEKHAYDDSAKALIRRLNGKLAGTGFRVCRHNNNLRIIQETVPIGGAEHRTTGKKPRSLRRKTTPKRH